MNVFFFNWDNYNIIIWIIIINNFAANGGSAGKSPVSTPKPYIPTSLSKPTQYNPPYPSGSPQGLHPVPHNTGPSYGK